MGIATKFDTEQAELARELLAEQVAAFREALVLSTPARDLAEMFEAVLGGVNEDKLHEFYAALLEMPSFVEYWEANHRLRPREDKRQLPQYDNDDLRGRDRRRQLGDELYPRGGPRL